MFQFFKSSTYYFKNELDTGQKYYFRINEEETRIDYINIKSEYVKKNISLKIRAIGLEKNESILMYLNGTEYYVNKTSLEINYYYQNYDPELIYFKTNKSAFIELIVGFLPEDLNLYKIIDFKDLIGKKIDGNNIIQIPKDLTEDFFNYSIIAKRRDWYYYNNIYITYDRIEFAVPYNDDHYGGIHHVTELFKSNPYSNVMYDEKKYFFITITKGTEIIIKKPLIYDGNFEYNKLNIIEKLSGNKSKYYYKIRIHNNDHKYLSIQGYNDEYPIHISNNDFFLREIKNYNFITIDNPFNTSKTFYINIYNTDSESFLNIAPHNKYNLYFSHMLFNHNITQIEGTNKIKINMTSVSFNNFPKKYKYYIFINMLDDMKIIYSLISEFGKPDSSLQQKLVILNEDNGTNKIIEYESEINTKLGETNKDFILPIIAENNLIEFDGISRNLFNFNYIPEPENKAATYIYYIIGAVCFLIIIVIIIVVRCTKNNKKQNAIDENTLSNNFEIN